MEPQPEEPYMSLAPYRYCRSNICTSCYPDLVEDRKYVVGDDLLVHQASAMSVAKHWYMRDKGNVVEMDVTVQKPEVTNLARIGIFICSQQILIVKASFD
jgi:hypothetical protein